MHLGPDECEQRTAPGVAGVTALGEDAQPSEGIPHPARSSNAFQACQGCRKCASHGPFLRNLVGNVLQNRIFWNPGNAIPHRQAAEGSPRWRGRLELYRRDAPRKRQNPEKTII